MDTVLDTVKTGFVRESCTNSNSVPINRSLLDDFKNRPSVLLFIYKPYIISYLRSFFFLSSYRIERVRFCVCTTVNAVTTHNVLYSCSQRQYCQITIFHLWKFSTFLYAHRSQNLLLSGFSNLKRLNKCYYHTSRPKSSVLFFTVVIIFSVRFDVEFLF